MKLLSEKSGFNVEKINNLRNTVAHNIKMNVSEAEFMKDTGLEPNRLMDILFEALQTVFASSSKAKITKEARNSYEELNTYIKDSM